MAQSISKQFQAAFLYLLDQEGRGGQARIADRYKVDRSYLNAVVKGKRSASEKLRTNIATYFQMTYEEMLALGRRLLLRKEGGRDDHPAFDIERQPRRTLPGQRRSFMGEDNVAVVKAGMEATGEDFKISEKIQKVVKVLESDTQYRYAMAKMIDALHDAVSEKSAFNSCMENKLKKQEGGDA